MQTTCSSMHMLSGFPWSTSNRFIVRQGRLPVPVQDDTQLCSLFQAAIGTDEHAAQIAAKAAAAAAEQTRMDAMASELEQ